jgi:hypothetical protein
VVVADLDVGRISGLAGLEKLQAPVEIAGLDGSDKGDDDLSDLALLTWHDDSLGERCGDRPIAPATSAALAIRGIVNLTARSRGRTRSTHSRNAVGSPSRASSTALRVNASASSASSIWAAIVALLREPSRLPPGLPDCPFANGRPRTRSARLSATSLAIPSPSSVGARSKRGNCSAI